MVLVIVIVVAWMVILGPSLMRRRSRTVGEIGSISHFHRQLRVLEHSAPEPIVPPAYRLRAVPGSGGPGDGPTYPAVAKVPVLNVVGAEHLPRPALAFLGEDPPPTDALSPVDTVPTPGPVVSLSNTPRPRSDADTRTLVRRRRRDTLGVLALLFVGTLLIGFAAAAAWVVTALSGVALAGYVALLVHMRRLAEERGRKLHYLQPGGGATADRAGGLHGRAAHPSYQAAAAH